MTQLEQIKAEIKRQKEFSNKMGDNAFNSNMRNFYDGAVELCKQLLSFIESLEKEEQPTCKSCGFYENNCPFIRDKFIPYPSRVCKDFTFSVQKSMESLDKHIEDAKKSWAGVDVDKYIDKVRGREQQGLDEAAEQFDLEAEGEITKRIDGTLGVCVYIDEKSGYKFGDNVIIQIRKK